MLEFNKFYPDSQVLYLEQNYRSTQTIVNASNHIIAGNDGQYEKNCFSGGEVGDPIIFHSSPDAREEAGWVSTEIAMMGGQGVNYKDIVILYRTNAQSRAFEEAFMTLGIPYKMVGSLGFYDRKEIKDVIAYLRVKVNPMDEMAFRRVLSLQKGFGKKTVEDIVQFALTNKLDFVSCLSSYVGTKRLEYGLSILRSVFSSTETHPASYIQLILNDTGYMKNLKEEDTPEADVRIDNLHELLAIANEVTDRDNTVDLDQFINQLSLSTDRSTEGEKDNSVTMMTIHSSKGLEFEYVFIVGLEESLLPHANSMKLKSDIEEERRLFYVASTRAKKQLYMTNARSRRDWGNNVRMNDESRFLSEIPESYICVV